MTARKPKATVPGAVCLPPMDHRVLDRLSVQLGMGRPETVGVALRLLEGTFLRSGTIMDSRPGPSNAAIDALMQRVLDAENARIEVLRELQRGLDRADRRASFRAIFELAKA